MAANVAAVRDVAARARPDAALANHLVMGPLILARALGGEVPYAVKIHGSALEYVGQARPRALRAPPRARGWRRRAAVLVRLAPHGGEPVGRDGRRRRCPAGRAWARRASTSHEFRPRDRAEAAAERARAGRPAAGGGRRPRPAEGSAFSRDEPAAGAALAAPRPRARPPRRLRGQADRLQGRRPARWPPGRSSCATCPTRAWSSSASAASATALERLLAALAAGDLDAVARDRAGRPRGGGRPARAAAPPAAPSWTAWPPTTSAGARYRAAAAGLPERVVLTGRLEHDELAPLLAACEAQVVPSTFPEAFGMVAAEAAACGVLPLSAAHSGLAEVTAIAGGGGARRGARTGSPSRSATAPSRRSPSRLVAWLRAPEDLRAATRQALVAVARERFSWEGVAPSVVAAARGPAGRPAARPRARVTPSTEWIEFRAR